MSNVLKNRVEITLWFLLALIQASALVTMGITRGVNVYDESVFLTIANGIVDGKLPYVYLWDAKPPGTYYLIAGVLSILGKAWWSARVIVIAVNLLLVVMFFNWAKQYASQKAALFGAVLVILGMMASYGYQVNTHLFASLCVLPAVILLYKQDKPDNGKILVVGGLCGLAFIFNIIAVFHFAAIGIHFLTRALDNGINSSVRRILLLTIGFMLPLAAAGIFLSVQGIFPQAIQAVFVQPFRITQDVAEEPWNFQRFILQLLREPAHLAALSLTCFVVAYSLVDGLRNSSLHRHSRGVSSFVRWIILFAASRKGLVYLSAVLGMGTAFFRYQGQHWVTSIPYMAFIASANFDDLVIQLKSKQLMARSVPYLVLIATTAICIVFMFEGPIRFILEQRIQTDSDQGREIYEVLSRCMKPEESILVVSPTPPRLYYMAQHFPRKPWLYIDESNVGMVSWQDIYEQIEGIDRVKAVILETHPDGNTNVGWRRSEPFIAEKFQKDLDENYRRITLTSGYHPIRGLETTIYMDNQILCNREPANSPLFP